MTKEQKMKKQIEEQQSEIKGLNSKVGRLADQLSSLQSEVNSLKQAVGGDISKLVERIDLLKKIIIERKNN
tara:strand:+ start:934 stop:1146 length:213 start_codon:yes stop_codon:yes gene_type:complete